MSAATLPWSVEIHLWALAALAAVRLSRGRDRIVADARSASLFRPHLEPGVRLHRPRVFWRWWMLAAERDTWRHRNDPPRRARQGAAVSRGLPGLGLAQRRADMAPLARRAPEPTQ